MYLSIPEKKKCVLAPSGPGLHYFQEWTGYSDLLLDKKVHCSQGFSL